MILQTNGKWQQYGSSGRTVNFTINFPGDQIRYSSGALVFDMFRKDDYIRGFNCKAHGFFYIEVTQFTGETDQNYKLEFRKDTDYYLWLRLRPEVGRVFPQRVTVRVWTPGSLSSRPTLVPLRSAGTGFHMFMPDEKP